MEFSLQIAAKRNEVVLWKAKSAVEHFVTLQVLVNKVDSFEDLKKLTFYPWTQMCTEFHIWAAFTDV